MTETRKVLLRAIELGMGMTRIEAILDCLIEDVRAEAGAERTKASSPAPFDIGDAVTCDCEALPWCAPGVVGQIVGIDAQDPRVIDVRYAGRGELHRTNKAVLFTGRAPDEWRVLQDDLASENAKLRAVAEAAAELVDGMGGFDAMDLRANVKRALAGWRTK